MNFINDFDKIYNFDDITLDFITFLDTIDIVSFTFFNNNDLGLIFKFNDSKYICQISFEEIKQDEEI